MWFLPRARGWLAASRPALASLHQPASYLGLVTIVFLWAGLYLHLTYVWQKSEHAAIQNTGNLAHAFAEHISRAIADVDWTIQILRAGYQRDPLNFDFDVLLGPSNVNNNFAFQVGLIGPDGILLKSNPPALSTGIDLSDREHFRVFAESRDDRLFVSKPLLGRVSNRWAIQLARGIRDIDGAFAGVIVASIDPDYLVKFYESIDLGKGGVVRLVGMDRVVRAQVGFDADLIGQTVMGSRLFSKLAEAPSGYYLGSGGTTDGTERLLSYRALTGYPLIVNVGVSLQEVFGEYENSRRFFSIVAALLTALILVFMAGNAVRSANLRRTREALRVSEARALEKSHELEVTLDHMNQGLIMIDPQGRIAVVNNRAIELLGLPPTVRMRPKHKDVMALRFAAGEYGEDGNNVPADVRKMLQSDGLSTDIPVFERTRPDGTILEVCSEALPAGGVVRTFTDITERKRYETQISHMAHHDNLTGLANRALFEDRIKQALGRLRRFEEGFAVLCLDLDRFKSVNDTYGHPAGDALLRMVADRLRQCVRETDTVARIGGDEFVVLAGNSTRREDLSVLAERIVQAVGAPYDLDGPQVTIGVSVGVSIASEHDVDIEKLLRDADAALYRAKSAGGDRYAFFEPGIVTSTVPSRRMAS